MSDTLRSNISAYSDFRNLRQQGIRLLELLSGRNWTDFNMHDPGITILEAALYSITEYMHRVGLPIEMLLQSPDNAFTAFTARPVSLYNKPVTVADIRKTIIDIYGINDCWLVNLDNPPLPMFFGNTGSINMTSGTPVTVPGLSDAFIELSSAEINLIYPAFNFSDTELNGNILRSSVPFSFPVVGGVEKYFAEFALPDWEAFPEQWQTDLILDNVTIVGGNPAGIVYDIVNQVFTVSINVVYHTLSDPTVKTSGFGIVVRLTPFFTQTVTQATLIAEIATRLTDTTATGLIKRLNNKIVTIAGFIRAARIKLESNRSYGSVFSAVNAVRLQEIVVDAVIRVTESVNIEALVTQFLLNIDKYLSPLPEAYSESELIDAGYTADRIFNGPLLQNGFLIHESLSDPLADNTVYVSNLIHAMTGDGASIRDPYKILAFQVSSYLNNYLIAGPSESCLQLPNAEKYRRRLNIVKSRIRVYREGDVKEIKYDKDQVIADFQTLNVRQIKRVQLNHDYSPEIDAMKGDAMLQDSYFSMQEDFPAVYHIGRQTIPGPENPEKLALARQLKAYLTFFDQVLADLALQIGRMHDIYSLNPDLTAMTPAMPLYEVPGIESLLRSYLSSGMDFDEFKRDTANVYRQTIDHANENPTLFFQRRGRLLDHLLARFGENLTPYTSLMLARQFIDPAQVVAAKKTPEWRINQDKLNMLREIATLGGDRFTGADFRKFILLEEKPAGQWSWKILDPENYSELISATSPQVSIQNCFNDLLLSLPALQKNACYVVGGVVPALNVSLTLNPPAGTVKGAAPGTFATALEADDHIRKTVSLCKLIWNTDNISGLEKKVARQLGFADYRLKNTVALDVNDFFVFGQTGALFDYSLEIEGFPHPFRSVNPSGSLALATTEAIKLAKAGVIPTNYTAFPAGPSIRLSDSGVLLAEMQVDATMLEQKDQLIETLSVRFTRNFGSQEGLYMIEHIQMLPVVNTVNAILNTSVFLQNPYLYQISIVVFDGQDAGLLTAPLQNRLSDPDFKIMLQKQVQKECAAHIYPFFINLHTTVDMTLFQTALKSWRLWKHILNNNHPGLEFIQIALVNRLNTSNPKRPSFMN